MRVIIVGCGRVGAGLAELLARTGHEVTVIDISAEAFTRLEQDFPGTAIRGDGTDEDVLRRAGTDHADVFFALTEGDNRNVLAAQMAAETFDVGRVVAKVNDPVRAEAYTAMGIATINRTRMLIDALATHIGLPHDPGAAGVSQASGPHHVDDGAQRAPAGAATSSASLAVEG
jgi:trk system potassium uptake protein TrkA